MVGRLTLHLAGWRLNYAVLSRDTQLEKKKKLVAREMEKNLDEKTKADIKLPAERKRRFNEQQKLARKLLENQIRK